MQVLLVRTDDGGTPLREMDRTGHVTHAQSRSTRLERNRRVHRHKAAKGEGEPRGNDRTLVRTRRGREERRGEATAGWEPMINALLLELPSDAPSRGV